MCPVAELLQNKGFQEWHRIHVLNRDGRINPTVVEIQRSSKLDPSVPADVTDCAAANLLIGFASGDTSVGEGCQNLSCRHIFDIQPVTAATQGQEPISMPLNLAALGIVVS